MGCSRRKRSALIVTSAGAANCGDLLVDLSAVGELTDGVEGCDASVPADADGGISTGANPDLRWTAYYRLVLSGSTWW